MIQRLYADNFRCLVNFTLDLGGEASVLLIGRNGAGKSTAMDALRLFQRIGRGAPRSRSLLQRTEFTEWGTARPVRFEIDLLLGGISHSYAIAFDWPEKFREARIVQETLHAGGDAVFTRELAEVQLAGGALFGVDWHVPALPVINEPGGGEAIQRVKEFLASVVLLSPIPQVIDGFSEAPANDLADDASNLPACLQGLLLQKPAAYGAFAKALTDLIPDFSSVEFEERGESGSLLRVNFEPEGSGAAVSVGFKSLSDGEKCLFLAAFLIARAAFGKPLSVVWDEPDNHLSLSAVGHLVTGLRRAARGGTQFIATTHHPETIRRFSDETTIVLRRESHLDPTRGQLLEEFEYRGDLISALLRDEVLG